MLLDDGEKVRDEIRFWNHDGFPKQCAAFGAANVKNIAECGEVCQGQVILRAGQGIGEARAIHIERDLIFPAQGADFGQLFFV